MKRDHESIFKLVSIFFKCDFNVISYYYAGVMVMFGGMGKNFCGLQVSFFIN